jgi:hypothetical protein
MSASARPHYKVELEDNVGCIFIVLNPPMTTEIVSCYSELPQRDTMLYVEGKFDLRRSMDPAAVDIPKPSVISNLPALQTRRGAYRRQMHELTIDKVAIFAVVSGAFRGSI